MAAKSNFDEWALVDDGGYPVVEFTSMISAEVQAEGKVPSEPIEEGSFATYNKIESPLYVRVKLAAQGEPSELQTFLDTLEELKQEITVFSLVTGEQEYKNLTLESFDYARKRDEGVNVIYADLHIVEIKEVSPQYSDVKLPAAQCRNKENASKVDTGKTQASETKPHDSVASKIL